MISEEILPLVSVVVPIYNEEKYIRETLESITNQDYKKLEIIVSDNYSSDQTPIICREFSQKDTRIFYYRQPENTGALSNHVFAINKTTGKYLMIASGHDKWSENLISECVYLLERYNKSTVAYGTPAWIGENGKLLPKLTGWYDTRGLNPVGRFFMVFWGSMNPILGIHRRDTFPDIQDYNFAGSDLVILAELALNGDFIHATRATFQRRQNRPAENYREKLNRYKSEEVRIATTLFSKLCPLAKLPIQITKVVFKAPITFRQKIFIFFILIPSFVARYFTGKEDHVK
ncbi:MAG: glycosyltransferase family 2 protein [Desulfobulbaceae bacterium]|nr:glycosyltransferase family 2 protein [Desulfobulbaceae bacterium]